VNDLIKRRIWVIWAVALPAATAALWLLPATFVLSISPWAV